MKLKVIALVALAMLSSSTLRADEITFDAVPITIATSYSEAGVTFTALNGLTFSAVPDPNGTNGLLSDSSSRSELKATLPSGGTQVSVDLGDFDSDPDLLVLRAFDSGNNLLDFASLLIAADFTGMDTLTVTAAGPIAYVTFGSEDPSAVRSSPITSPSVLPLLSPAPSSAQDFPA
jgi:hypothetical protein